MPSGQLALINVFLVFLINNSHENSSI